MPKGGGEDEPAIMRWSGKNEGTSKPMEEVSGPTRVGGCGWEKKTLSAAEVF